MHLELSGRHGQATGLDAETSEYHLRSPLGWVAQVPMVEGKEKEGRNKLEKRRANMWASRIHWLLFSLKYRKSKARL